MARHERRNGNPFAQRYFGELVQRTPEQFEALVNEVMGGANIEKGVTGSPATGTHPLTDALARTAG